MNAKISLIQFDTHYRDIAGNVERMAMFLDAAAGEKPDLIVMPELWSSAYSVENFHEAAVYAQPMEGSALSMVRRKARKYGVWIVAGSMLETEEGRIYNTAFLVDREGNVAGRYRKMHLYGPMDETLLEYGTESPVFDTDFGRIALMTCYDLRFVELSRAYALQGAELLVVVSNWAAPKLSHWQIMLRARAIENQLPVVACNRVGTAVDCTYFGHSMIVDAWGEVLLEDESGQETVLRGELDMDKMWDVRRQISMYADRRPECYPGCLLEPYDGGLRAHGTLA